MMKKMIMITLYIIFIVFTFSQLYAEEIVNQVDPYDLNRYFSKNDNGSSIKFNWIMERYSFGQYIQSRYGTYYKYYEEYLNTQQEIAGKFGLTSIYVRPDFRQYDNTKLILVRNVWSDKLSLKYLAPLHDMGDFELMLAFRPNKSFNIILRSDIRGEGSIAIAITHPFGEKKEEDSTMRYTRRIIKKIADTTM
jgi:hypothetical protein